MHLIVRLRLIRFALCVCLLAAWAAACGGDDESPPAQEAPVPPPQQQVEPPGEPAAEPAPPPPPREGRSAAQLLLSEADALERNGYWENALASRARAVADAAGLTDSERLFAQLDQARLLLRLGRAAEADDLARRIDAPGLPEEAAQLLALLAARAALALDEPAPALAALDRYVESEGAARAYIQLERARVLERLGRLEEARHAANRAIANAALPDALRRSALWLTALILDEEGDAESAIARYEEVIAAAPWEGHPDIPAAVARIAALSAELGDTATAEAGWRRLVAEFPRRDEALAALEQLRGRGYDVDSLTAGLVRYRHGQSGLARTEFIIVLSDPPSEADRAAAEYYIAAINEDNGASDGAILGYLAAVGHDPEHDLSADARWWAAELLEARGESAEALYADLFRLKPGSRFAPEAAARHALYALRRGEWDEAAQRFRGAANFGADHWELVERQRLLLWSGIAYRQAGDEANARLTWERAINLQPGDWHALRAMAYLGQAAPQIDPALDVEEWLTERFGERPGVFALDAAQWFAAAQLRSAGYDDAADAHFYRLAASYEGDGWALWEAARLLSEAGETSAAAAAAAACLRAAAAGWWEAPAALVRLAYPAPWRDLATSAALIEGVDPGLLYSLIRRESLYDPDARGLAGEIGLTQVIPPTGADIAQALGEEHDHERLARPETAFRYGAWYLGAQLAAFDGAAPVALSAYNGGPGNAARWLEAAAPAAALLPAEAMLDAYVSAIDFPGTRSYVRAVMEAWVVYQALAAAEAAAQ